MLAAHIRSKPQTSHETVRLTSKMGPSHVYNRQSVDLTQAHTNMDFTSSNITQILNKRGGDEPSPGFIFESKHGQSGLRTPKQIQPGGNSRLVAVEDLAQPGQAAAEETRLEALKIQEEIKHINIDSSHDLSQMPASANREHFLSHLDSGKSNGERRNLNAGDPVLATFQPAEHPVSRAHADSALAQAAPAS